MKFKMKQTQTNHDLSSGRMILFMNIKQLEA